MPEEHQDNDETQSHLILAKDTIVGHYRIVERIGAGGMGEVYLAEDTELNRKVALKFLLPQYDTDEDLRARFKREAQAAAALSHPNIITIHDVAEFQGRPFFAMEMVEGHSLRDMIRREELSLRQILDIAIQLCEGLTGAHEAGVTHRDIKPANILIDNKGRTKILDFGLATIEGVSRLTRPGSTVGTVGYMSPEQAEGGQVDHRSDIFSLGVILYEMITGRQPFRKEGVAATLNAIIHETPEPLARYKAKIPDGLQQAVDRLLDKNRDLRYQHADDILADLKRIRLKMDSGYVETPVSIASVTPPRSRLYRRLIGLSAFAVLAVVILMLIPSTRQAVLKWVIPGSVPVKKHLAVLPFTNIGSAIKGEAFCDGLLETLTSKLTQLEQFQRCLWVIPASEVRGERVTSARRARQAFGVTLAVTGSVQFIDGRLQMTLNLVDAKNERQLHSTVIDALLSDLSDLQDSVVFELAGMLEVDIRPEGRRLLAAGGTAVPEAYEFYLRGRGHLQHYDEAENIDSAISLFEQALGKDSSYALAYAGLGEACWHIYVLSKEPKWIEPALANCRKAVRLDDHIAPAHITLGLVYRGTGRYDEALNEFKQALILDSVSYSAYRGMARTYERMGEIEQAELTYKKVIQLKPDYWDGYFDLCLFYIYQGRGEEALRQLDEIVKYEPEGYKDWNNLGALYFHLEQSEDALEMWERSLEIEPNYGAYSNLGTVRYMEWDYAAAAEMYEKALEIDDWDHQVWMNLASAYYWVPGQRDTALATYERAIEMAEKLRKVNPRDPEILSQLAECYAAIGKRGEAIMMSDQALSLAPDDLHVNVSAGVVHEMLGERDTALQLIGRALTDGYPRAHIERLPELQQLLADPRFKHIINSDESKSP